MKRFNFYKKHRLFFLPTFGIVWRYKDLPRYDYKYGLKFMWLSFVIEILFGEKRWIMLSRDSDSKGSFVDFYSEELLENARVESSVIEKLYQSRKNEGSTVEWRQYTPLGQDKTTTEKENGNESQNT